MKPRLVGDTPRVVIITSGKGGVSKTTTTANVGLSLARPASPSSPSTPTSACATSTSSSASRTASTTPSWRSNFELLSITKHGSNLPIGFGGKALKSRPEGCPDFIIINCPAGIDAGFITPANEAVLITTPDITSLRDALAVARTSTDIMKKSEEEERDPPIYPLITGHMAAVVCASAA